MISSVGATAIFGSAIGSARDVTEPVPQLPGTVTYVDNPGYTTVTLKSDAEREADDYRTNLLHRVAPMTSATGAVATIQRRLERLDKLIATEHPSLQQTSWDFSIQPDGQLSVSGVSNKADSEWLSNQLNSDPMLRMAVDRLATAAVDYLQTDDDNPPYGGVNGFTGKTQSYAFADVREQLDGKLNVREMIGALTDRYSTKSNPEVFGGDVMNFIAARLSPTP